MTYVLAGLLTLLVLAAWAVVVTMWGVLDRIDHRTCLMDHKLEALMAINAEVQALLSKLDAATTKIADNVRIILAGIGENATPAEILAALKPHLDALDALGASTETPIPPIPTVPEDIRRRAMKRGD